MKLRSVLGVLALLLLVGAPARAQYLYQLDNGNVTERFNNSQTTETEDNWVANSFEVVADGTRLVSVTFRLGENFNQVPLSASIYLGSSLTDPSDIIRIATTETLLSGNQGDWGTITLDEPIDLEEGTVFYAVVLIPAVTGDRFPFFNNGGQVLGRSFFDVGPMQGAPYDLDNTVNVRVFGDRFHPVVPGEVQSPGTLLLRVNATTP